MNRKDYILALANLVNGSLLGYEDKRTVPEYKKVIEDYVEDLEREVEKLNHYKTLYQSVKSRNDKAIEYISTKKAIINTDVIKIFDLFEIDEQGYTDELLTILKGDSNE